MKIKISYPRIFFIGDIYNVRGLDQWDMLLFLNTVLI